MLFEDVKKENGILKKYKLVTLRVVEVLRKSGFIGYDPKHKKITDTEQLIIKESDLIKNDGGEADFKKGDQIIIFYYHNKDENEMKKMIKKLKSI